jgi:hypothetical protein
MVFDVSVKIVKLRSSKWIIKLTSTWNDLRADVNVKWFESWCQSEAFESWRQREQTWKLTSTSPNFRAGVTLKGFKSWCNRDRIWEVTSTFYQLLTHGRWFSLGTPASSTAKTGHHDIAEILLKVKNQIKSIYQILSRWRHLSNPVTVTPALKSFQGDTSPKIRRRWRQFSSLFTLTSPPTMGKQLVNFITYGCESSAPFL